MTFALISKGLGWVTPLLTALVAYAVLTVDLIGAELQNPFAPTASEPSPWTTSAGRSRGI